MISYAIKWLASLALDMVQEILDTRKHFWALCRLNTGSSVTSSNVVFFGFCDNFFILCFVDQFTLF